MLTMEWPSHVGDSERRITESPGRAVDSDLQKKELRSYRAQTDADGRVGHPGRRRHPVVSGDDSAPVQFPKPRVVVGWRSRALDQEQEFRSRELIDVTVNRSSTYRLHRVWRCCIFGERWADRLQAQGEESYGRKRKVPTGYITAIVKAFCIAEDRGRVR